MTNFHAYHVHGYIHAWGCMSREMPCIHFRFMGCVVSSVPPQRASSPQQKTTRELCSSVAVSFSVGYLSATPTAFRRAPSGSAEVHSCNYPSGECYYDYRTGMHDCVVLCDGRPGNHRSFRERLPYVKESPVFQEGPHFLSTDCTFKAQSSGAARAASLPFHCFQAIHCFLSSLL